MALLATRSLGPDIFLGLWAIQETEEEFFRMEPELSALRQFCFEHYHSQARRLEFLAVRALVHRLVPEEPLTIGHEESGKPTLSGWSISISHTVGYAAVLLSKKDPVGIDIEYYSNRVEKVASRFLRADEQAPDLSSLLIHWSAKETVYKYDSEEHLRYDEMRVHPFSLQDTFCLVDDLKVHRQLKVFFEVHRDFVLTFTYGRQSD
ncbi:4'-phosphopantetheinyl transferase superfamily protein [Prevotella cerevisiae]|uniref:4'-phosphopantetheinyl transferase superfamily protein n=1 Tax=Segatella cerevisiae TaxID=2053716 RepID=A0ABT1BXL2_9BACT|nr:4'-phosphopantetheinyl transferase family protein [Segatella cerevisiae]MCO6025807.1 4'-phosphopantetheinyl transferase superfamily protein [Segatella cerevisiae]